MPKTTISQSVLPEVKQFPMAAREIAVWLFGMTPMAHLHFLFKNSQHQLKFPFPLSDIRNQKD